MCRCKYDPDTYPECVEGMARDGMIETEMAKALGIAPSTFAKYKNDYPEFLAALRRGKAPVDTRVENALLKRALGYEVTETVTVQNPDGTTREETRVKHVPPSEVACIYWLKNRKPEQWRDKQQIEHSGTIKNDIADDELINRAEAIIRRRAAHAKRDPKN